MSNGRLRAAIGAVTISAMLACGGHGSLPAAEVPGTPYVYKTVAATELHLFVLAPADATPGKPRPTVVFYHGGGFTSGDASQFAEQSKHLCALGVNCVLVEYRLLDPGVDKLPLKCISDAKSALRWVRRHAAELDVDTERIAAAGGSAGGYLAAFIGMCDGLDDPGDDLAVSTKVAAMILFNPGIDEQVVEGNDRKWGPSERLLVSRYLPVNNIRPGEAPMVMFFGSDDPLGAKADRFRDQVVKAGNRCDLHMYAGQKHGFFGYKDGHNPYYLETLAETDRFLASLGWIEADAASKHPPGGE